MYNAEKYIGQCLQSLADQTFQDFEIIVVNDCSTDNSVVEVEKFFSKFENRLRLENLKKNTGGSAIPKNTGIQMARGKYVTFLDSDDYFTKNALEELVKIAEENEAEIVHCSKFFSFYDGKNDFQISTFQRTHHVDIPTLENFDIAERIKKFTEFGFLWWGQCKLYRSDFLIKNKIQFPPISVWEDLVFSFQCVVLAKNYVRTPNIIYCYRVRENSLSNTQTDPFEALNILIKVINYLDEFTGRVEFFQKNPYWKLTLFDWYIQARMNRICKTLYRDLKLHPFQVGEIFRQKFAGDFSKELIPFASSFFAIATYQNFYIQKISQEKN